MVNTTAAALARANSTTVGYGGLCLAFVTTCYQAAPRFGSAIAAWNASSTKVITSNLASIPVGAPIWFAPNGSPYGHVAIYAGGGLMRTTNSATGRIHTDRVSLWQSWGYRLLGWTRDIEGQPIPDLTNSTQTSSPLTTGDTDMALLIRCKDNHCGYKAGDIILWQPSAPTAFKHITNQDSLNIVKWCYPGIKQVESGSKGPWIIRARQATPKPVIGFGVRG